MKRLLQEKEYSDRAFWKKASRYAKSAGLNVMKLALSLYYTLQDEDTPKWAKTVIYGSLIYFISPFDAFPDMLPGGYVDDLGTLLSAAATVSAYRKEEHTEKSKTKINQWFKN